MTIATLTSAYDKKRRLTAARLVKQLRDFAIALYTAHGGWLVTDAAQPASGALARQREANRSAR